jgi:mRNA interferase MazF
VKRREIWTVAGAKDYAGKPRPALVIQHDSFDSTDSITICATTTSDIGDAIFRVPVVPTAGNGLRHACFIMADKVATVPRGKLGRRIGLLAEDDMARLNRAVAVFLGIAG